MDKRPDGIALGNASCQVENPTVALIRKNRIHIPRPNRRLIAHIKTQLFQFLLQAAQIISGAQQDYFSGLDFDCLPGLSQPLVDKQRQTFPTDSSATIALYDEL